MTPPDPEIVEQRARRFRARLILWSCVSVVAFFGLIVYAYLADGPPPDDADLMVQGPIVPAELNGLTWFRSEASLALDFVEFARARGVEPNEASEIQKWKLQNDTLTRAYLKQVQPLFVDIEAASQQPNFELSATLGPSSVMAEAEPLASSARALRMAAMYARLDGDYTAGPRYLELARNLARRTASAHAGLVDVLTAMSMSAIIHVEAANWLNDRRVPPAQIQALQNSYVNAVDWAAATQFALKLEYRLTKNVIQQIKSKPSILAELMSGNKSSPIQYLAWNLQVNRTNAQAAQLFRRIIHATGTNYSAAQPDLAAVDDYFTSKSFWKLFAPNGGGRAVLIIMVPMSNSVVRISDMLLAQDALVLAGLSVRRYHDDHHALPAKLDDLVPQYISAVPIDPFDGKPLRYDAKRGLIYSVGTSLKDNGGSKYLNPATPNPDNKTPLTDREQPTLELTFQNPPTPQKPEAGNTEQGVKD